jgi:mitochondrial ribonuclease P protein 1
LQKKKENVEEREKSNSPIRTNYPGHNTFQRRPNVQFQRLFYRNNLLSSIINNAPHIVLDFRYVDNSIRQYQIIKSIWRQTYEIISINRKSREPFQLHFCNYNKSFEHHKLYGNFSALDENLIFETEKSYIDIFPKEKLVYLSRDAKHTMKYFDPDKIYIIGMMIDQEEKTKYASLFQAKKDNIVAQRLPIDENIA